jgi:hypothetical protein
MRRSKKSSKEEFEESRAEHKALSKAKKALINGAFSKVDITPEGIEWLRAASNKDGIIDEVEVIKIMDELGVRDESWVATLDDVIFLLKSVERTTILSPEIPSFIYDAIRSFCLSTRSGKTIAEYLVPAPNSQVGTPARSQIKLSPTSVLIEKLRKQIAVLETENTTHIEKIRALERDVEVMNAGLSSKGEQFESIQRDNECNRQKLLEAESYAREQAHLISTQKAEISSLNLRLVSKGTEFRPKKKEVVAPKVDVGLQTDAVEEPMPELTHGEASFLANIIKTEIDTAVANGASRGAARSYFVNSMAMAIFTEIDSIRLMNPEGFATYKQVRQCMKQLVYDRNL